MDSKSASNSDLLEMKRKTDTNPATKSHIFSIKFVYIAICLLSMLIIWFISFVPSIGFIFQIIENSRPSNETSITEEIPPLNTSAANYSITSVNCQYGFVYEPKQLVCYPACDWDPLEINSPFIVRVISLIFASLGVLLSIGTLVFWLVTSYIEYSKKRLEFNLSRTSLSMVILSDLGVFVTLILMDSVGREGLFCERSARGELYLVAHAFRLVMTDPTSKLLTTIFGSLFYFFFISTITWLTFSFLNILFVLLLSIRFTHVLKRDLTLFLVEMVVSFGLPLVMIGVIFWVDPDSPFMINNQVSQIIVSNFYLFNILELWLYSVISGLMLTTLVIVLTKLRIQSLKSANLTDRKLVLSELEKRLLLFSIFMSSAFITIGISFVILLVSERTYFRHIRDYIICVTINSPVTINSSGSNQIVYRDNNIGDLSTCDSILSLANDTVPFWYTLFATLLFRGTFLIIFIILFPSCFCKRVKNWFKC